LSNQEKSVTKKRGRTKSEPTTVIRLGEAKGRSEAIRRLIEKALGKKLV
jgi:hypothetical protein